MHPGLKQLIIQWKKKSVNVIQAEEGNVMILVALSMVVLLGMSALAIDVGDLYLHKQDLQSATDAGALAGATAFYQGSANVGQLAKQTAQKNVRNASYTATLDTANQTIDVKGTESVPLWFARIFGSSSTTVSTESKAKVGSLNGMNGISPIAMTSDAVSGLLTGQQVALTEMTGNNTDSEQQGNFGYLDVGSGAQSVSQAIQYGSNQVISVGQQINTETGDMWGPVKSAVESRISSSTCQNWDFSTGDPPYSCSQVIYIPIVQTLDVNGTKPVTVIGFAAFYLTGVNDGTKQIEGKFINVVTPGTAGTGSNFNTYGVKLIQP